MQVPDTHFNARRHERVKDHVCPSEGHNKQTTPQKKKGRRLGFQGSQPHHSVL